jgi:hypothetical protein
MRLVNFFLKKIARHSIVWFALAIITTVYFGLIFMFVLLDTPLTNFHFNYFADDGDIKMEFQNGKSVEVRRLGISGPEDNCKNMGPFGKWCKGKVIKVKGLQVAKINFIAQKIVDALVFNF